VVKRLTVKRPKSSHVIAAEVKMIFEKVFCGVRKRARAPGNMKKPVRCSSIPDCEWSAVTQNEVRDAAPELAAPLGTGWVVVTALVWVWRSVLPLG
jgi:hypothetical protein